MSNQNQVQAKSNSAAVLATAQPGQPLSPTQRIELAKIYANSQLVPKQYQNNIPDCYIALEMAERYGGQAMMVMQNLYIVNGRPSWSSQFVIATLNSCGRFTPLKFKFTGEGNKKECLAYAQELKTKELLEGPVVSIQMAIDEGWMGKSGSKWKTMPDVMLRYRAASFFGRLYAPDLLMGMYTQEEILEGNFVDVTPDTNVEDVKQLNNQVDAVANIEELPISEPEEQDELIPEATEEEPLEGPKEKPGF